MKIISKKRKSISTIFRLEELLGELENPYGSFLKGKNPKIEQKIKLLEINYNFLKDVKILRKKWRELIKKYTSLNKNAVEMASRPDCDSEELAKSEIITFLVNEEIKILSNNDFQNDLICLAKKYKLYPTNLWKYSLTELFIKGHWGAPRAAFLIGVGKFLPPPENLNFAVNITKNKGTKELELFVQIFEDTSIQDLKKNWKIIEKLQKELRIIKGLKKRYYPLKNLNKFGKLNELDNRKPEPYYDYTNGKEELIKLNDLEKAEEIYGEGVVKKANKTKNKLKQIRYQYRKRLNS